MLVDMIINHIIYYIKVIITISQQKEVLFSFINIYTFSYDVRLPQEEGSASPRVRKCLVRCPPGMRGTRGPKGRRCSREGGGVDSRRAVPKMEGDFSTHSGQASALERHLVALLWLSV